VWIGHSLGGVVALRAAALNPDAVRGLVLAAAAGIGSTTRAAQVTLAVLGVAKPGRLIAPYRHSWARSRLGRRAAFGWWAVADPDALAPELAEAFLEGRTTPTRVRRGARCSPRTRAPSSTASGAHASVSGERATTGSPSTTESSMRADSGRRYGRSPAAGTS
jgi:pimeloyl-ACP methyl ester carboxylesterase